MPGTPSIILTETTGSISDNGTLVSAPASGKRLVVPDFTVQNESGTATTIILQSGSTDKHRLRTVDDGDGITKSWDSPMMWWYLDDAEALNISIDGSNQVGYTIRHFTQDIP
jgi:hypothetical protein